MRISSLLIDKWLPVARDGRQEVGDEPPNGYRRMSAGRRPTDRRVMIYQTPAAEPGEP
jgi:hypothetical protein